MRLTYPCVYSYENKHNPIGGNASNDQKKINLITFREIYSHKNNVDIMYVLILFSQYSHKIIEVKERQPKHLLLLMSTHRK